MSYKVIKKVKGELQTVHLDNLGFFCKYGFDEGKMLLLIVSPDKKDAHRLNIDKDSIANISNILFGNEIVPRIYMNSVFSKWFNEKAIPEYNEYLKSYNPDVIIDYSVEFEEIEDE